MHRWPRTSSAHPRAPRAVGLVLCGLGLGLALVGCAPSADVAGSSVPRIEATAPAAVDPQAVCSDWRLGLATAVPPWSPDDVTADGIRQQSLALAAGVAARPDDCADSWDDAVVEQAHERLCRTWTTAMYEAVPVSQRAESLTTVGVDDVIAVRTVVAETADARPEGCADGWQVETGLKHACRVWDKAMTEAVVHIQVVTKFLPADQADATNAAVRAAWAPVEAERPAWCEDWSEAVRGQHLTRTEAPPEPPPAGSTGGGTSVDPPRGDTDTDSPLNAGCGWSWRGGFGCGVGVG
ncbi:hypothetical protein [Cellulomonas sp. URHB0016]